MNFIDLGSRLEPMVDDYLIERLDNAALKLHHPHPQPLPAAPLVGDYATVIKDGDRYRAWYRDTDPQYCGKRYDGHPGAMTCYAESQNGQDWTLPDLGLFEVNGSRANNVVLFETPACHTFAPFLDTRPGVASDERFKALGGLHDHAINETRQFAPNAMPPDAKGGLYAFASQDGIHWRKLSPEPVIPSSAAGGFGFDSQNVSFWSEAEGCYVCYFRTWQTPNGRPSACAPNSVRSVSRCTSADYLQWSDPVALFPNNPGEHLYTTQTHPYFRAPHIYIATPTRFMNDRGASTDILFMTARGVTPYARPFKEAWIRPGLAPERWGNRSNYLALNVVPTSPEEMSLYHDHSGLRYVLRTDGFASVHAGATTGEMLTRPLAFTGRRLTINYSTAAAGAMQVELQRANGRPLPGLALEDCPPFWGDAIEHTVTWKSGADLSALAGQPVRLRFVMQEADLFALRFK
jgi:hypothetical protein